ncbi:uncharacterized protein EV422DRAFT_571571 [Fimicolochytrium jonesii]|uniref:uncharacterized protein n=1 Tax=Fimicolochytrium jonesii TaxID=1396493 RepID=UPI0022FED884|nr:uncharacterized protein EV422DRAFT_571571 [Fimicolochytrium jonesii]KAI8816601.1 hypothetical protein EV422DRAFT_571571 [Fimicolochytrium jonesii]
MFLLHRPLYCTGPSLTASSSAAVISQQQPRHGVIYTTGRVYRFIAYTLGLVRKVYAGGVRVVMGVLRGVFTPLSLEVGFEKCRRGCEDWKSGASPIGLNEKLLRAAQPYGCISRHRNMDPRIKSPPTPNGAKIYSHPPQQVRYRLNLYKVPVRYLETIFRIPYIRVRIGLSTLIGLVPFVGAAITATVAFYPLVLATQVPNLPPDVVPKMMFNMVLGGALGLIPFVGGLIANIYRPTWRNLRLIDRWVTKLETGVAVAPRAAALVS